VQQSAKQAETKAAGLPLGQQADNWDGLYSSLARFWGVPFPAKKRVTGEPGHKKRLKA